MQCFDMMMRPRLAAAFRPALNNACCVNCLLQSQRAGPDSICPVREQDTRNLLPKHASYI